MKKTTFTLPVPSIATLWNYKKLSEVLSEVTGESYFVVHDNTMEVFIQGNKTYMNFHVDAENFESEKDEIVFSVSLKKLSESLRNISPNGSVSFEVNEDATKITLKSLETSSKVSLPCFDQIRDAEVAEARSAITNAETNDFGKSHTVSVTNELFNFMEIAMSFMSITKKNNAILVNGNTAKYSDSFSIIAFTCAKPITDTSVDIYLHGLIYSLLDNIPTAMKKDKESIPLIFSEDKKYMLYRSDSPDGLQIILQVPPVQLDQPSEEDEKMISPSSASFTRMTLNKAQFIDAMGLFNGIFDKASWKWKPINFAVDFATAKDSGVIKLNYADFNAEVDKDVTATNFETTETKDYWEFLFSSELYAHLMNLVKTENFVLTFSSIPADEENGMGVTIESEDKTVRAICTKILR